MAPSRDDDPAGLDGRAEAVSRRRTLTLAGTLAATLGLTGCLGGPSTETASPTATATPSGSTTSESTASETATPSESTVSETDTATDTPQPAQVTLRRVESFPSDAVATVYPRSLRDWLRRAALSDGKVRATAGTFVTDPEPILPQFDRLELRSDESSVAGTYDLTATGDTYYELLVGAKAVDSVPEDATVTPLSNLSQTRREFARRAIDGEGPRVSPETKLGEWVRTSFFGGYYRTATGTVYRGRELQQTDAEFFSREVWCILSLSPIDATDATTLELREIPIRVQTKLNERLADLQGRESLTLETTTDSPLAAFARETPSLLTHTARLEVEVTTATE